MQSSSFKVISHGFQSFKAKKSKNNKTKNKAKKKYPKPNQTSPHDGPQKTLSLNHRDILTDSPPPHTHCCLLVTDWGAVVPSQGLCYGLNMKCCPQAQAFKAWSLAAGAGLEGRGGPGGRGSVRGVFGVFFFFF